SLAALLAQPATAANWKSFRPADHCAKARISVGGKELTYYHFTTDEPLTFSVDGPTRVKVLTRVRVPNDHETVEYGVSISRDGVHMETVEKEAYPKESAFYVAFLSFRPGVIRRIYIDVPTGRHEYELRTVGGHSVDARLFESAGSKPSLVSVAPRDFDSVETLYYRDKELTYYLMTKATPVVLDVVGPTSVKVNTRLLYDATMLGEQTYIVGVSGQEAPECLYRIDAKPSETVVMRDRDDVIPGALRHFVLEVPRGVHTYTFRLVDAAAGGLAVKFYIPRGDVTNEP
ncbi:MAG: hypothetical protein KAW67_00225, partial [Candidatus Eisenbacteria sp.]|nr:hypothetical protein [Candidatus Eisenbacteria bacterium]